MAKVLLLTNPLGASAEVLPALGLLQHQVKILPAEANLELVRKLDIRSTPTTLFLDSRGHEVGRAMGAPKRDQVLKAISAIA